MTAIAATAPRAPRASAGAVIGFGLIWLFLIVFVLYPLTRIFYDAFTNEAGQFTLANFHEFFTDRFYLRSLWNSLLLGVATVLTTSVIGRIGISTIWCSEPASVLAEVRRVLRFPGLFLFTTLGPDTLRDLRSAWPPRA